MDTQTQSAIQHLAVFDMSWTSITAAIRDDFGIPQEEMSLVDLLSSNEGVDWKGEAQ